MKKTEQMLEDKLATMFGEGGELAKIMEGAMATFEQENEKAMKAFEDRVVDKVNKECGSDKVESMFPKAMKDFEQKFQSIGDKICFDMEGNLEKMLEPKFDKMVGAVQERIEKVEESLLENTQKTNEVNLGKIKDTFGLKEQETKEEMAE